MDHRSRFSYQCNQCGRCCHDQVITLSPYDVIRMARATGISTGEAVARYTIRRGSLLKFERTGACTALSNAICTIHSGRPLACRLYPLGLERHPYGAESYISLTPAAGSMGVYGCEGSVQNFLASQGVREYYQGNRCYVRLLDLFRRRIAEVTDFELVEPREFWRVAIREALAEVNFDTNLLINALFDPDSLGCATDCARTTAERHVIKLESLIHSESDPLTLAPAAIMLAISLGYPPAEVVTAEHD